MDVRIEYHSPDQVFAAVWMRDGEPWFLNGALVGMDDTPDTAVKDLIELSQHLIFYGENFLTQSDWPQGIPLADRKWLFSLMDGGGFNYDATEAMFLAVQRAEDAEKQQ